MRVRGGGGVVLALFIHLIPFTHGLVHRHICVTKSAPFLTINYFNNPSNQMKNICLFSQNVALPVRKPPCGRRAELCCTTSRRHPKQDD